jgi:hypothetical protein
MGLEMKQTDVFCAILKAAGVVFSVYAIKGLPAAIRYTLVGIFLTGWACFADAVENHEESVQAAWTCTLTAPSPEELSRDSHSRRFKTVWLLRTESC